MIGELKTEKMKCRLVIIFFTGKRQPTYGAKMASSGDPHKEGG